MYVCCGPEGQLYWTADGNHRLFMATILKKKEIPVRVLKRHANWQKTRDLILSEHENNIPVSLEKHKLHPDIIGDLTGNDDDWLHSGGYSNTN
jgi:ParB-like chromosome segregation protein Spo0J